MCASSAKCKQAAVYKAEVSNTGRQLCASSAKYTQAAAQAGISDMSSAGRQHHWQFFFKQAGVYPVLAALCR